LYDYAANIKHKHRQNIEKSIEKDIYGVYPDNSKSEKFKDNQLCFFQKK
jgi:hypothetical protein